MKKIAFFDFDGTITNKDSLIDFIIYAVGKQQFYKGMLKLSPILIAYKLKIIPNHTAKQKMINIFFKNWDATKFKNIAQQYSKNELPKIIKRQALRKIEWHKRKGDDVVIVSASIRCWLEEWCNNNNIVLISTELEINNNKITGMFKTPNCYGIEKINRISKIYDLKHYDYIYSYGDSEGDKELLEIANKAFYKEF